MTIQVYFNSGNPVKPWHVGIHDGKAIAQSFGTYRTPIEAIRYALDTISAQNNLPVVWPEWLKVVIA